MSAESLGQPQELNKRRRTAFHAGLVILIVVAAGLGAWYAYLRPLVGTGGDGPPHLKITRESPTGLTFVVSDISTDGLLWSDVTIRLVNVSRPGDPSLEFAPTSEGLEGGNGQMTGAFKSGDMPTQIDCSLTDVYVQFVVGEGDYFTIIPNGTSLEAGLLYEVSLMSEPYGEAMGDVQFPA